MQVLILVGKEQEEGVGGRKGSILNKYVQMASKLSHLNNSVRFVVIIIIIII